MKLDFSYNREIDKAHIIRVSALPKSVELAQRCAASCIASGQRFEYADAFDGTSGEIIAPSDAPWHNWIKQTDQYLSVTEVACAMSHIALWVKCIEEDQPLIILEHDAIVVAKLETHPIFGSILYLGCSEQMNGWQVLPTPPHATNGANHHFICRAHAYAIDPQVAKNMLAHVIKYGIHESLDVMLRADIFPVVQMGLYAYDSPDGTTITGRKKNPHGGER